MNVKYWYEFKGLDDVLNRVEILSAENTNPKEIKGADSPFSIEYIDAKKLEPIQGSRAGLRLISKSAFQFINLHTDNMQGYVVKFYRAGLLYWVGCLDSELYQENLTDSPPYAVEFSGADFNILERLKFRNENEKAYTDIVPFIVHLKRCFDKLGLPFQKLYIGCSTVPNGVAMSAGETPLHVLYMMSRNFYDEESEPMTCREVVESILQPFGLMMVQKNADVYIYDYNTVKQGSPMKRYNYSTFAYEAAEVVNFNIGNLADIGIMSTEATYGFEEMVNNVTITSSLYAGSVPLNAKIEDKTVSESYIPEDPHVLDAEFYKKSENIENVSGEFVIYYDRNLASYIGERDAVAGCYAKYEVNPALISPIYRVRYPNYITKVRKPEGKRKHPYYVNLKVAVFPGTTSHPLLQEAVKNVSNSGVMKLYCNLYIVDAIGKMVAYYNNSPGSGESYGWVVSGGVMKPGRCVLWFSSDNTDNSILDAWITNGNKVRPMDKPINNMLAIDSSLVGKGIFVSPDLSGYLIFEITNKSLILNPVSEKHVDASKIKLLLYNDIDITIVDPEGRVPSKDDYEFKSYVNKNVANDFEEVTLKCISANEEKAPIGKSNILKKVDDQYEFQLSYTRAGQTDILERLLMCTIHSNFTTKNKAISLDVKMTDNPALHYVTYKSVIQSDGMYITCALLDFYNAKIRISAVDFSADVAKLSIIPYD